MAAGWFVRRSPEADGRPRRSRVITADPMVITMPSHPRGAVPRAFDHRTGRQIGGILMPAQQTGTPMTYRVAGRQYIIVAVSCEVHAGEYICQTLPGE